MHTYNIRSSITRRPFWPAEDHAKTYAAPSEYKSARLLFIYSAWHQYAWGFVYFMHPYSATGKCEY